MNEIALYSRINDPLAAITEIGEFFAKSGMFGCDRVEQGKVLATICLSENKSPVEVMRTYHIVDGQLSKKAMAILADFRKMGGKHRWINDGQDGKAAKGWFRDPDGEELEVEFTIEDAKRQGLVKPRSNWEKIPGNMLRARVITNAIAMLMPEIMAGDPVEDAPPPSNHPVPLLKKEPKPVIVEADSEQLTFVATQNKKTGLLTKETRQAIIKAIGKEKMADFCTWMIETGWLTSEEGLGHLSIRRAQSIIDNPDAILALIDKKEAANG